MKQNVFDVLMYLFENYMNDDNELDQDQDMLQDMLLEAGFKQGEIRKAFDWLEGLADLEDSRGVGPVVPPHSMRLYAADECKKLDTECRGFLLFLEQMGVLDQAAREMVVDRAMALDEEEVDLEQLKWVVLMVLFNQPGREAAAAWMEDLVLDEMAGALH